MRSLMKSSMVVTPATLGIFICKLVRPLSRKKMLFNTIESNMIMSQNNVYAHVFMANDYDRHQIYVANTLATAII